MALVDAVERTPIDDTGSLSEHAATYQQPKRGQVPQPVQSEPDLGDDPTHEDAADAAFKESQDPSLRFKQPATRRPESHKANPEEVAKIGELTKALRTKEAELAKAKPDAVAGSPRLRNLQRQIRAVEAELADLQPKPERREAPQTPAAPPPSASVLPPASAATAFTEPAPKLEDFANEDDPYAAMVRAMARWDRRKDAFEERQQQVYAQQQEAVQRQQQAFEQAQASHRLRVQAQLQAHPELLPTLEQFAGRPSTPLMDAAVMTSDRGGEIVVDFLRHPEIVDELLFSTYNLPVNDSTIAALQRRLHARLQADPTAAASAPRTKTPPKPPTAVRTGPMSTGLEPPGDGASLAEHEAFFAKRRR